jgi:hypothetical protein
MITYSVNKNPLYKKKIVKKRNIKNHYNMENSEELLNKLICKKIM